MPVLAETSAKKSDMTSSRKATVVNQPARCCHAGSVNR